MSSNNMPFFLGLALLIALHSGAFWMGLRWKPWIPVLAAGAGLSMVGGALAGLVIEEGHSGRLAHLTGLDTTTLWSLLLRGFVCGIVLISLAGLFWLGKAWAARSRGLVPVLIRAAVGVFHVALATLILLGALAVLAGFMGDPGPREFRESVGSLGNVSGCEPPALPSPSTYL